MERRSAREKCRPPGVDQGLAFMARRSSQIPVKSSHGSEVHTNQPRKDTLCEMEWVRVGLLPRLFVLDGSITLFDNYVRAAVAAAAVVAKSVFTWLGPTGGLVLIHHILTKKRVLYSYFFQVTKILQVIKQIKTVPSDLKL